MLGPLLVLALVLTSDAWVVWDATQRRARGADVVVTFGPVALRRPEHWLVACVVLWLIAFPLYLVARRES